MHMLHLLVSSLKVLLGESRDNKLENVLPSNSGLETVLDVLRIQKNYWSNLGPVFAKFQSRLEKYTLQNKSEDHFLILWSNSILV